MFVFTWARLGIFFAILIGLPSLLIGGMILMDYVENHEEAQPWCITGCVFILVAILAALVAFVK